MSSRIWTWSEGTADHVVVPSLTASPTSSVVSFDSILSILPTAASRMETVPLPQSDSVGEAPPVPKSRPKQRAEPTAFEQYKHHDRFFFEDGNITFLVEKVLYHVHRYFLTRDSTYFASRLTSSFWDQSDRARTIISMPDVTLAGFDAFMSILYPLSFDSVDISSIEEWTSVLHLSTLWGFATVRSLALRHLDLITVPLDRLVLGRTYAIDHWVLPALVALCERPQPINLDEARRMDLPDIILIHNVREAIRDSTPGVAHAGIQPLIEAWLRDSMKPTLTANFDTHHTEATGERGTARTPGAPRQSPATSPPAPTHSDDALVQSVSSSASTTMTKTDILSDSAPLKKIRAKVKTEERAAAANVWEDALPDESEKATAQAEAEARRKALEADERARALREMREVNLAKFKFITAAREARAKAEHKPAEK